MNARALVVAAAVVVLAPVGSNSSGTALAQARAVIDFPTSGNEAAQALFIKGVAALHSLDHDTARDAFIEAQASQRGFAMAAWGEAMTYTDAISQQSDAGAARTALAKLGATAAARLAKAPTPREKDWLGAVERLYGAGDTRARTAAYADAMKRLTDKYPDDLEAKSFYALALLGTMENGRDVVVAARAATVLDAVLAKNPQHPGALLYAIAAYDDPAQAATALKYAEAFSPVAPEASAALHLASHPYAAIGRWDDVAALNQRAMKAAGPRRLDAMLWLIYSYAQQGRYSEARGVLDQLEAAARDNGAPAGRAYVARARSVWLIETRKWADAKAPLTGADVAKQAAAADLFALGLAGVRSGNRGAAAAAMQQMAAVMQETPENLTPVRTPGAGPGTAPLKPAPGPKAVTPPGITPVKPDAPLSTQAPSTPLLLAPGDLRIPQVMAQELEAVMLFSEGRRGEAAVLARQAAVVEALIPAVAGPPMTVKPVNELAGEILIDLRQPKEAMQAFQQSLRRYPRRALSLLGLARASTLARDPAAAQAAYSELKQVWAQADPSLPELREIAAALAPKPSSR